MEHSPSIAWIGVGKLGHPMAMRVADAGFPLTVFDTLTDNTAPFHGKATVAASQVQALAGAELAISTIPNDAVLTAVALGADGVIATLPRGAVFVDMSTVSPEASAAVAAEADQAGVAYLRAPVSGSVAHAEQGILTVLCSGDRSAYDRCLPIFDAFSAHSYHVGVGEEARYLKLVINNLVGSTAALLAESLALGRKGGLDWQVMLDVIANSAVASPLVKYKVGPLGKRDFTPAFTTAQMIKDIGLVVDTAEATGCSTPLATETLALLREQAEAGMAEEDFSATVKLMEARAGLPPLKL